MGKTIRNLRISRGLTQLELANVCGCTQAYLSFLESGDRRNVSLDLLKAIAKALKVEPGALLRA